MLVAASSCHTQAVKAFAADLPNVTFETVEDGYHDLLSKGPLQQQCLQKITDWISSRAGLESDARLLN